MITVGLSSFVSSLERKMSFFNFVLCICGCHEGQRSSDPLELELQAVVCHLT